MKDEGKKRRRSMAIPETTKDLPTNKKLKDDIDDKQPETELPKQSIMMEVQDQSGQSTPVTEIDRRKRLREILKVITRILREKDVFNIVHSPPCPLLYPNYNFNDHFDMSHVAKRIDQLCYYNIYQFRQAVDIVTKIQTDFFPHNTVRHEFALKFDQFTRKQTTYRALVNLCTRLEIKDEISKKELRDMLVGTELITEIPYKEPPKNNITTDIREPDHMHQDGGNFPRRQADNFTTLSIASGAFNEAHINGKPVTIGDITGKVIGAPMLPRRTRTIEDKAYTISYMNYGAYGTFGPTIDSRSATISREDSDLMFKTNTKDEDYIKLEKIAELNPTDSVSYLVNSVRGELKEAEKVLESHTDAEPNPIDLLSLQKEGIDVSFLNAFDPDAEIVIEEDATVEAILAQLGIIIPQLANLQDKRLLSNRPVEMIDTQELKVAGLIQKGLTAALSKLEPGAAYTAESIRKAIGVKN